MQRINKTTFRKIKIAVPDKGDVSAVLSMPDQFSTGTAIVVAHGAGNDMEHPLLVSFCGHLAAAGDLAVRFNFPYTEQGRKAPDRQDVLEETWRKVLECIQYESGFSLQKIFTAGKSMGGRVASQMLAKGSLTSDGMIFLGYPLHPAGNMEKLRDEHLPLIKVPMLFFAGTRDPLCDLDLLKNVLTHVKPRPELEIIDGGDHSFNVPKSSPLTVPEIYERLAARSMEWMEKHAVS